MGIYMAGIPAVSGKLSLSGEGAFWQAELEFASNPGHYGEYVVVEDNFGSVLVGYIKGGIQYANNRWSATVVARRPNYKDLTLAQLPNDDPWVLFRNPYEPIDPAKALAARSAVVSWDRSGNAQLVDIVNGQGEMNIGDGYIADTITVSTADSMIAAVDVTLTAEWEESKIFQDDFSVRIGTLQDHFARDDISKKYGHKVGEWTIHYANAVLDETPVEGQYTAFYRVSSTKNPSHQINHGRSGAGKLKERAYNLQTLRRFFNCDIKTVAIGNCKRREIMRARLLAAPSIAGVEGTIEKVDLTVSNLDRGGHHPNWISGHNYVIGDTVDIDGISWKCATAHKSDIDPHYVPDPQTPPTGNFFKDIDKWSAIVDEKTALGGDFKSRFFGSGAVDADTPGASAVRFALNQALAKMRASSRIYTVTFQVPWETVRALNGWELVTVSGITGKVTTIEADLVGKGRATITIKAVAYNPVVNQVLTIPDYVPTPLEPHGNSFMVIKNDYVAQEIILAANVYTQALEDADIAKEASIKAQEAAGNFQNHVKDNEKSVHQLITEHATSVRFKTASVPKGKDYYAIVDFGQIQVG